MSTGMERTLRQPGFAVQRVTDMDGWLGYHAAFVACVAAALYRRVPRLRRPGGAGRRPEAGAAV